MNGELMPALLESLKKMEPKPGFTIYSRALRAMALAVHNRRNDRAALAADLKYMLEASMGGAYDYDLPATKEKREARRYRTCNGRG